MEVRRATVINETKMFSPGVAICLPALREQHPALDLRTTNYQESGGVLAPLGVATLGLRENRVLYELLLGLEQGSSNNREVILGLSPHGIRREIIEFMIVHNPNSDMIRMRDGIERRKCSRAEIKIEELLPIMQAMFGIRDEIDLNGLHVGTRIFRRSPDYPWGKYALHHIDVIASSLRIVLPQPVVSDEGERLGDDWNYYVPTPLGMVFTGVQH